MGQEIDLLENYPRTIHNLERDEWYTVKTTKKLNLA